MLLAQVDGQELSCPAELPQPVTRATFVKAAHGGDTGQWAWVPALGKVYSLTDPYGDTGRKLVDSPVPIKVLLTVMFWQTRPSPMANEMPLEGGLVPASTPT